MSSTIITPSTPLTKAFEGHNVRILVENEAPIFHLGDVLKAVESKSETHKIVKTIEEDYRFIKPVVTSNGTVNSWFINEYGLIELLLSLRVPKAKPFKKWAIEEVIPTVLKTGEYKTEAARELTKAEQTKQEIETLGALAKAFPELRDWSQYQAKASAQLMLGMTVERELEERLVSVQVYLVEHGWKRVTVDGKKRFTDGTHLIHDGTLGKEVAKLYREKHGEDPKKRVDGASGRLMNMYATADLPLFESAINNLIK